jgi:hypothetical protein
MLKTFTWKYQDQQSYHPPFKCFEIIKCTRKSNESIIERNDTFEYWISNAQKLIEKFKMYQKHECLKSCCTNQFVQKNSFSFYVIDVGELPNFYRNIKAYNLY